MKIEIEDVEGPDHYQMAVFIGDELNPTYLSLHRSGRLKFVSFMAGLERIATGNEKWWPIAIMTNADANTYMRRVRPLLFDYFTTSDAKRAIIDQQVIDLAEPFSAIDMGVLFITPDDFSFESITFHDADGAEVERDSSRAVECVISGSECSRYGIVSHQITGRTAKAELAEIAQKLQWRPEAGYVDGLLDFLTEIQLTLSGAYRVHPKDA